MADPRIEHVVVLMLENRSFDHMLGYLDHPDPAYERLSAAAISNRENPADPTSKRWPVTSDAQQYVPMDPDHAHDSVMTQLGLAGPGLEPNSGFVQSYLLKAGAARVVAARKAGVEMAPLVMACMTEDKVPALSRLAKQFAVCTRWFSSVPGETWPNRNFVHAATSDNTVNIELGVYTDPTIFEQLDKGAASDDERHRAWRIYFDGPAQAMAFSNLRTPSRLRNWAPIGQFRQDAATGNLARYTFIEPNHSTPGARLVNDRSNSQHPGNNAIPVEQYAAGGASHGADFRRGDALIAEVYEALRSNQELFEKTVLVITYDEHGGWFDHVPPPACVPPGDGHSSGILRNIIRTVVRRGDVHFKFDRLGVRVPTVIVSPWIKAGTIDSRTYDHSSVPKTVREVFVPTAPALTRRDAAAASFADLVEALASPRTGADVPNLADLTTVATGFEALAIDAEVPPGPPDSFQRSLDALAIIVGETLDQPDAEAGAPCLESVAGGGPDAGDAVDRRARGRRHGPVREGGDRLNHLLSARMDRVREDREPGSRRAGPLRRLRSRPPRLSRRRTTYDARARP